MYGVCLGILVISQSWTPVPWLLRYRDRRPHGLRLQKAGNRRHRRNKGLKDGQKSCPRNKRCLEFEVKKSVIVNAKSFPDVQSEHSQTLAITAASVEDRQVCAKCQCALYRRAVQKSSPNLPGQVSSECQVVSFSPVPQCLGGLVTPFWLSQ